MLSVMGICNELNASLIFCRGYDKNKTHSVIFMLSSLDELKMICSSKYIYANLVINATCVCIYIYILNA
jgi:hypothetical protein